MAKTNQNATPTMTKTDLMAIANRAMKTKSLSAFARWLDSRILATMRKRPRKQRGTWEWYTVRFIRGIRAFLKTGDIADLPHTIFAEGNGKLPFAAFSALPAVTCPGAGDCLSYCYSFRSWRYPAPFFRQLQNTLLIRFAHDAIRQAWMTIATGREVRLYVDGDFDSAATLRFWFGLMMARQDLHVYGYSKSWELFLDHAESAGAFPENYALNLSSGSRYETQRGYLEAMQALPCTRGEFVAVPVDGKGLVKGAERYRTKEYHKRVMSALRANYPDKRVLSCPGKCGSCGASRHHCGNMAKTDVVIGIGIH